MIVDLGLLKLPPSIPCRFHLLLATIVIICLLLLKWMWSFSWWWCCINSAQLMNYSWIQTPSSSFLTHKHIITIIKFWLFIQTRYKLSHIKGSGKSKGKKWKNLGCRRELNPGPLASATSAITTKLRQPSTSKTFIFSFMLQSHTQQTTIIGGTTQQYKGKYEGLGSWGLS